MAIGIYKIENIINHKVYIGQSRNISERWRAHRTRSQIEDTHLYRSIREYGLENFTFTIIEECLIEELNDKEKYWIKYYNSNNPDKGYNQTIGGQDEVHRSLNEQQIDDIYEMLRQGLSQQIIADKYNITQQLVSLINLGISYTRSGIVYPIKNNRIEKYCIDCGIPIKKESTRCKKCAAKHRDDLHYEKQSYPKRDELKQMIRTLPFTKIGEMFGVTDNAIRRWCDHYSLPRKKTDIKKYSNEEWEKI